MSGWVVMDNGVVLNLEKDEDLDKVCSGIENGQTTIVVESSNWFGTDEVCIVLSKVVYVRKKGDSEDGNIGLHI